MSGIGHSAAATLEPAGLENAKGAVSDFFLKDPTEPQYPSGDTTDGHNVTGPDIAQTFIQALEQCGDDLTRENIMKQAANLHDFGVPMLLPGITIDTSPQISGQPPA